MKRKERLMLSLNKRAMTLLSLTIPLTLLASGCEKKVLAVAVKPPASLLTCSGEPLAPILPPPGIERDRIVTDWLLAMRGAWGDCSSKLAGVRSWADALPD
jgi:hypothetical protein